MFHKLRQGVERFLFGNTAEEAHASRVLLNELQAQNIIMRAMQKATDQARQCSDQDRVHQEGVIPEDDIYGYWTRARNGHWRYHTYGPASAEN